MKYATLQLLVVGGVYCPGTNATICATEMLTQQDSELTQQDSELTQQDSSEYLTRIVVYMHMRVHNY